MARILVVEDTAPVRLVVATVLEDMGHAVDTAENGLIALDRMKEGSYDLIVTDVLMPEVDGIGVIKAARRLTPAPRVLAISGGAPNLPAGYALKMTEMFSADAVLYKPFLNEELERAVTGLLAAAAERA